MRFRDALQNGLLVERADAAEIDYFGADVVLGSEDVGRGAGGERGAAVGDERDVCADALDVGLAERDEIFLLRHLPFFAVEERVLHEHHGVVVADGGLHEALCVVGGSGAHDLEAGDVCHEIFVVVRVRRADVRAAVRGPADDDGAIDETAAHVADLRGVIDDLIPRDGGEAPEHEFHDGANAEHRGADAHADECGLADGRVHDALAAPFFPEALGDFVCAVVLGDFLAHEDDVFVARHFFVKGLVECVAVFDECHGEIVVLKIECWELPCR